MIKTTEQTVISNRTSSTRHCSLSTSLHISPFSMRFFEWPVVVQNFSRVGIAEWYTKLEEERKSGKLVKERRRKKEDKDARTAEVIQQQFFFGGGGGTAQGNAKK